MKLTTTLFLSFAFATALGSAHAEDITPDDTATPVWTITKTRAEVGADIFAARQDGTLMAAVSESGSSDAGIILKPATGIAAALRREMRAQRSNDLAHAVVGEDSGSFFLSKAGIAPAVQALTVAAKR